MIKINLQNLQKKVPIKTKKIESFLKDLLKKEEIHNADLSIVFVSPQKMCALNIKFLNHHYTTDVLSFCYQERPHLMGEIIVSPNEAIKYCRQHGGEVEKEILYYVVHGFLHLLGYDDHSLKDIKRMRKKEQEVLRLNE